MIKRRHGHLKANIKEAVTSFVRFKSRRDKPKLNKRPRICLDNTLWCGINRTQQFIYSFIAHVQPGCEINKEKIQQKKFRIIYLQIRSTIEKKKFLRVLQGFPSSFYFTFSFTIYSNNKGKVLKIINEDEIGSNLMNVFLTRNVDFI